MKMWSYRIGTSTIRFPFNFSFGTYIYFFNSPIFSNYNLILRKVVKTMSASRFVPTSASTEIVNRIRIDRSEFCSQFLMYFLEIIIKVRLFCVLTSYFTCRCRISSPTTWIYSYPWCQPFSIRSPLWNIALHERYLLFSTQVYGMSLIWNFFSHGKIYHKSLKIGTQHRHSPFLQSSKKNGIRKNFWGSKYMLKLVFVQHWKKPSKMKMATERSNIFFKDLSCWARDFKSSGYVNWNPWKD